MGIKVGLIVGVSVGVIVGEDVGSVVGVIVGIIVGERVGSIDGVLVGYHYVFFDAKVSMVQQMTEEEAISHYLRSRSGKESVQALDSWWVAGSEILSLIYINPVMM